MNIKIVTHKYIYIFFAIILAVGFMSGYFYHLRRADQLANIHPVRDKDNEYTFINPLLFYDVPSSSELGEYKTLSDKIKQLTDKVSREKNISVSVYYRDLNEGRWVGINEEKKYTPASLMKVVLMMAYLKKAESRPDIFKQKITFSKDIKNIIGILPYDRGTDLVLNHAYTVEELIDKMITNSDNGAAFTLLSAVDDRLLNQLYSDLGFKNPGKENGPYLISAKDYASFFRILYNATYLNREMSERALKLLSKSDFKDGLVSGVDSSIQIVHKYGESVSTYNGSSISSVELHDCGIIYYPKKPYLLCLMTEGKNITDLIDTLGQINRIIYKETSSLKI